MRLIYLANVRLPTDKAHGLQIMKTCGALPEAGADLVLVVPRRLNPMKDDPLDYYLVRRNFRIVKLPTLDLVPLGWLGFIIETSIFSFFATLYVIVKKPEIVYSREEWLLYPLSFWRQKIFWEAHHAHWNFWTRRVVRNAPKIFTISEGLKDFFAARSVPAEKIVAVPDAVDYERFAVDLPKEEARQRLNLPFDKKIVVYTGHLYKWKGATVLLEAARNLQFSISNFPNTLFVFVGGTTKDIQEFKQQAQGLNNVLITGHRPWQEMPIWLKAADLLVIPNSATVQSSALYTSPLKLFEYLASGTPILAADVSALREIVSENEVEFFEADNLNNLVEKINYCLANLSELQEKKILRQKLARRFSWQDRARKIYQNLLK